MKIDDEEKIKLFIAGFTFGRSLKDNTYLDEIVALAYRDYMHGFNAENVEKLAKRAKASLPYAVKFREEFIMKEARKASKH